uniref:FRA10A associated CGG repeat 1 n=1 Tax=Catharus ustulatus TaxID=91951 RepID=A0A8C3VIL1_CATUS
MVFIFSLKEIVDDVLLKKPFQKAKQGSVVHRQFAAEECDREEARKRRFHLISMDAYERHKKFVHDYILYYGGKIEDFRRSGANDKTDLDIIRENHRFLWNEEDEADMNWEKRLAKKYYDKLFKEYCIADLSRYKENKFGFRWRHEKEVISGKGQFSCGNKHCDENEGLKSWEVNFGYVEHGEKRNALVKLSKSAPSRRCTLKRRQCRQGEQTRRRYRREGAAGEPGGGRPAGRASKHGAGRPASLAVAAAAGPPAGRVNAATGRPACLPAAAAAGLPAGRANTAAGRC